MTDPASCTLHKQPDASLHQRGAPSRRPARDVQIALGARARRLQSGFIHREMALTFAGIALVVGVLLVTPLYL